MGALAATKTTATPKTMAAPKAVQAAPAPQGRQQGATKTFAQAKPRGGTGLYLKGQPDGSGGKYTLRVNKVVQNWASPKAAAEYEERPTPTPEELATAKPTFKKQDNFIVEVEVVESNVEACPPGYLASITITDKYEDSYFDDVKGFLCACTGDEPEAIGLDDWKASYQPDQPLANYLFDCIVLEKPTSKGGVFTKHVFTVNKDQNPEAA